MVNLDHHSKIWQKHKEAIFSCSPALSFQHKK